MKFLIYVFYRLRVYYSNKRSQAFIILGGLLNLKFLSITIIISTIFNYRISNAFRVDYGLIDRFVIIPALLTPIYLAVYIFYKINRMKVERLVFDYSYESKELFRKNGRLVLFYVIGSLLFFLLGITSPGWLKLFR
jgi:hypothetical protein